MVFESCRVRKLSTDKSMVFKAVPVYSDKYLTLGTAVDCNWKVSFFKCKRYVG